MAQINERSKERLAASIIKNPKLLYEEVLEQHIHTGSITFNPPYPEHEKGKTVTIPFVLTSDFGFSLGNKWSTVLDANINDSITNITKGYNSLTALGDARQSDHIDAQVSFQSKLASIANYKSSTMPVFQVEMTFVCTQRSYNPSEIIKSIAALALPLKFDISKAATVKGLVDAGAQSLSGIVSNADAWVNKKVGESNGNTVSKDENGVIRTLVSKTSEVANSIGNKISEALPDSLKNLVDIGVDAVKESVMHAPLYYNAVYDPKQHKAVGKSGTVTLHIGNWFVASDLVCTDISGIKFSKETVAPPTNWSNQSISNSIYSPDTSNTDWGFPLYASCTVSLRPCSLLTYQDFCAYFTQNYNKKNSSLASNIESGLSKLRDVRNLLA